MVDVVVLVGRLGDDVFDGLNGGMEDGDTLMMVDKVMAAVADGCRLGFL